ncbi:unnamed protein product [Aphanomyces euteiches]|uniref:FAM86 N-terminal domain-containing protein n=1 Tax=Aphanomyces euteiches TaxID=100861 RepID=A0A6G0WMZ3_9STRA|nr:hypothetical protein Ae201684_013656 [Aphanomyces euteiches]KAH9093645.1 hypothetical protein Ae201684P_016271 [Aphanomyces euteiches]
MTGADMLPLLDLYRSMAPLDEVMDVIKSSPNYLLLDFQDAFVAQVLRNTVAEDYAPRQSYTFRLLKRFVEEIETHSDEISDALVEEMLAFVSSKNAETDLEQLHHVSYRIPRPSPSKAVDDVITCRVAAAHNEVGMKLWEAGFFLAEYAIVYPEVFRGKRVVELGAGAGFTGLVLAAQPCVAAEVVLTDYAPIVMQNLRYNIEINTHRLECPVRAMTLDWTTWRWEGEERALDLLIAGDCVYDVSSFPALMQVIGSFLVDETKAAIFASTLRNEKTFSAFLQQLHDHAIHYEDISATRMPRYFAYDNRESIRLCRLTKSSN